MTRRVVYGVGLWSFLAATAMTLAALIIPEWLVYESDIPSPNPPRHTYGLHTRCTTLSTHKTCHPFPTYSDCRSPTTSHNFCSIWRSTGFLLNLTVVLEFVTFVAFAVVLLGGKQKRVRGYIVLSTLVAVSALCQVLGVGIMGWQGAHEKRFEDGWVVGRSWALAVAAAGLQVLIGGGIVGSRYMLEEEGGYELIPDREA